MNEKKKILIVIEHYLPGFKDGGPVRSIKNMTDQLKCQFEFYILTKDRDQGDLECYSKIRPDGWNEVGETHIWYASPDKFTKKDIKSIVNEIKADVIYVCGCFGENARDVLWLKKTQEYFPRVIVASMGLFSPGAFSIKKTKKMVYILLFKLCGLFKKIEWSATSLDEVEDIYSVIGKKAVCYVAEDLPQIFVKKYIHKASGENYLKVVFLSRISQKKNLQYAINVLKEAQGNISFDIYGNKEDKEYFTLCMAETTKLPTTVSVSYKGELEPDDVLKVFSRYDVFLFPTLGENFGHVIIEAMAAGCIPVISDTTPWNDFDKKNVGNVIALDNQDCFVRCINHYVQMTETELLEYSERCFKYAINRDTQKAKEGYCRMLDGE